MLLELKNQELNRQGKNNYESRLGSMISFFIDISEYILNKYAKIKVLFNF